MWTALISEVRRMRLSTFATVANLPLAIPHLKIALLKWCYAQKPKNGYVPVVDEARSKLLKDTHGPILQTAEECLAYFHIELKDMMTHLTAFQRAQWLGNVDRTVVTALWGIPANAKSPREEFLTSLKKSMGQLMEKCQEVCNKKDLLELPVPPVDLPKSNATLAVAGLSGASSSSNEAPAIVPKVIQFDAKTGKPLNEQERKVTAETAETEVVDYWNWATNSEVVTQAAAFRARNSVLSVLSNTHFRCLAEYKVEVLRGKGSRLKVIATEPLLEGTLRIPPAIAKATSLMEKSNNPHAVAVSSEYCHKDGGERERHEFALAPELSVPAGESTSAGFKPLAWTEKHNAHLFWLIHRDHQEEAWNCELHDIRVQLIVAAGFNSIECIKDKTVANHTTTVTMPILTNTRNVAKGEEIVLKVAPPSDKKKKQSKTEDWKSHARAQEKKEASAKGASKRKADQI